MSQIEILTLSGNDLQTQSDPALNITHYSSMRVKNRDTPSGRLARRYSNTLAQQLRANYINAKFDTETAQRNRKQSRENIQNARLLNSNTRRSIKADPKVRKNSNARKNSTQNSARQRSVRKNSGKQQESKSPTNFENKLVLQVNKGHLSQRSPRSSLRSRPASLQQKENTLPADFVLGGHGKTEVQWSRYNSPKVKPKR